MAERPETAPEEKGAGRVRGKPPVLLLLIALSSMGSLAMSAMALMSRQAPAPVAAPAESERSHRKKPRRGAGEVVRHDLGEFLVNLADADGQAFVKATIVVECEADSEAGGKGGHGEKPADKPEAPTWDAPVRDAINIVLSLCRRQDLRTPKGKESAKQRILDKINDLEDYDNPEFTAVYFTSIAMQ